MTEPPLTVDEAAVALSVSRWTVYREHRRGKLKFIKVGGSTRVKPSEIERYLRAAERTAA